MESHKFQKAILLIKQYADRTKKSMTYGKTSANYPSFNFYIKGRYDVNAILGNWTHNMGGITIPISNAIKTAEAITKLPEDERQAFYNSIPIITDFETEYWYFQNQGTIQRKKAFCSIKDMPGQCMRLFTNPVKSQKKSAVAMKKEYHNKLKDVFGTKDDSVMIRMLLACMNHASKNLYSSIPLPVAPMITGDDASKFYCFKANDIYNKYREHFNLFKVVYYPLHPQVFERKPHVLREIVEHLFKTKPDIAYLGTLQSENFLFPSNKFNPRKPSFRYLVDEFSLYAKTNAAIVGWYDKGNFTSSYGLRLIRDGFDTFIAPLKGHYYEGGFGYGAGPQYAYILNEFAYYNWQKYLQEAGNHFINEKSKDKLEAMTPQQQWMYKRLIEIRTRTMQFDHIHEKLEKEGSLEDYDIRLKRNKIE